MQDQERHRLWAGRARARARCLAQPGPGPTPATVTGPAISGEPHGRRGRSPPPPPPVPGVPGRRRWTPAAAPLRQRANVPAPPAPAASAGTGWGRHRGPKRPLPRPADHVIDQLTRPPRPFPRRHRPHGPGRAATTFIRSLARGSAAASAAGPAPQRVPGRSRAQAVAGPGGRQARPGPGQGTGDRARPGGGAGRDGAQAQLAQGTGQGTGTAGMGDRHSQQRGQARLAQGTGMASAGGEHRAGDRHSHPRVEAQPAQGTGQGTDTAIPGDRHGWHKGQSRGGQAWPFRPPQQTLQGTSPLPWAHLGKGPRRGPRAAVQDPAPQGQQQCPSNVRGPWPRAGPSLSAPGGSPRRLSQVGVRRQRTLSLQVPLRLRGWLRSSRRADRSRRRDEVELRSPQLCRWMPSWGRSAPGQALQGTCNPMGTSCSCTDGTPNHSTVPSPALPDGWWTKGSRAGTQGGRTEVARDGGSVHHAHMLSLRMGSFLLGPPEAAQGLQLPVSWGRDVPVMASRLW